MSKRKNPLSWDMSKIPEIFRKKKMLRSYAHDRRATKAERQKHRDLRMRGITSIQPRKQIDTIQNWLPSTEFVVYPETVVREMIGRRNIQYLGKQYAKNGQVIVSASLGSLLDVAEFGDQFTPFMMLHDVMETFLLEGAHYYYKSHEHPPQPPPISTRGLFKGKKWDLVYLIDGEEYVFTISRAFFPILLPNISLMYMNILEPFSTKGDELRRRPVGTQYLLEDGGNNLVSDMFAVWAMKERLKPNQFIYLGDDEFNQFMEHPAFIKWLDVHSQGDRHFQDRWDELRFADIQLVSKIKVSQHAKKKTVQALNKYFAEVLSTIKKAGFVDI